MELTNQSETPDKIHGYRGKIHDLRYMDKDQSQCSNKNELMLTIKNKTDIGNTEQILNTGVNTFENPIATETQENSNRPITVLLRKYLETENQFQKTPVIR